MALDGRAIGRVLSYIEQQLGEVRAELAKEEDEYSVFMTFERFDREITEALAYHGIAKRSLVCIFDLGKHRCSRCESVVKANMDRKRQIKCDA